MDVVGPLSAWTEIREQVARAAHQPDGEHPARCLPCDHEWPCDAYVLIAEVDRFREVLGLIVGERECDRHQTDTECADHMVHLAEEALGL